MTAIAAMLGSLVGVSLGMTGGGGAIFAVPLLVHGLGVSPREAIGVSLLTVGSTAAVGFVDRLRLRQVELKPGILFAIAGMLGAPLGTLVAGSLPEWSLLVGFAGLMLVVAYRLWKQAKPASADAFLCSNLNDSDAPTCRRDSQGNLILATPCAVLLLLIGVVTGALTGLFGVGGGFVIVPALVLFSGMRMSHAIGTSLMVVTFVSLSGIAFRSWSDLQVPLTTILPFVVGGWVGLFVGQAIGRRLSTVWLQKVFAIAMIGVAGFMVLRMVTG